MAVEQITIRGARQHNLKNLSTRIPRGRLTVITGLSGSGKSSLAFDTIYAEGQRRYVETLSAYARQFLDQMERPEVDAIDGLSPAIAIEQRTTSRSPRSTVGTITEIYDYLRLLWAAIGVPHCPRCGRAISRQSVEQIVQTVMRGGAERVTILAPLARGRKGEFRKELAAVARQGIPRARIDGEMRRLDEEEEIRLDKRKAHTIEAVVDRLALRAGIETRLAASLATAMRLGDGLVLVAAVRSGGGEEPERLFSEKLACVECGINVPKLEPRSFSFNSRYGACETCHGLGSRYDFDPAKVIADWSKPLLAGGLGPGAQWSHLRRAVASYARRRGIELAGPFADLPRAQQRKLLDGEGAFAGVLGILRQRLEETGSEEYREYLMEFTSPVMCADCQGQRLRPESLAVRVAGLSIAEFAALPVSEASRRSGQLELAGREREIAGRVLAEVRQRLQFLLNVGLGYLSLARGAGTLSGGEAQRIRLAGQIGSELRGVLYVLDEPSIGLHPRDNERLLRTLERLREMGNTVLVVEHDEATIKRADHVLDLGPGAGRHGGELVAAGTPAEVAANPASLTGQYLTGARRIPVPRQRRKAAGEVVILAPREHNLKGEDVALPLGVMIALTGVSGAGKSTLMNEILYPAMMRRLYGGDAGRRGRGDAGNGGRGNGAGGNGGMAVGRHGGLRGAEALDKVIRIDQAPIGRTPRSNPATYTGALGPIREIYAQLPLARERGYGPGRFSFNVAGGRCEACRGEGQRRIAMNFLPDVYVRCEVCGGRRYNRETLEARFHGASIADVLESPVSEALELFSEVPRVHRTLATLQEIGLGYVHLGQSAATLSGGEAQRIKLARELSRRQTGRTLYLLEEPTTGLHFEDVRKLLEALGRLVALGNTVLVIEHNLDVIKTADWVVDLGPEGGEEGGHVVAAGTPEQVAKAPGSHTGAALRVALGAEQGAGPAAGGAPGA